VLARGSAGGTDLSGGQWQRVALARALCALRPPSCEHREGDGRVSIAGAPGAPRSGASPEPSHGQGGSVVLLDEPTAQLDVRGEAEIFDRILAATKHTTTILISHRFSTVRHAERICVVEHGRVIELGSHDELMALGGRYREMFELQAKPFAVVEGEEEAVLDALA
jgi:ATP-binding cassette subfamily B protein